MVFGPFAKTEFFVSAGNGFHSNDVRGVTITEDPTDPANKLDASPLLVRTQGAEVGVRTQGIAGLDSSVSLFMLDQASELVFSGDAGDTEASRPSRRVGVEFTNNYRPSSWLAIDADLAMTHARFVGFDTEQAATLRLARRLSAGADRQRARQLHSERARRSWLGRHHARREDRLVRHAALALSRRAPLTEDNAFRSPATGSSTDASATAVNGWRVQLDALNLPNSKTDQITYAYGSLIKTDNLFALCFPRRPRPPRCCQNGVMDRVLHPVEPLAVRLTVAGAF